MPFKIIACWTKTNSILNFITLKGKPIWLLSSVPFKIIACWTKTTSILNFITLFLLPRSWKFSSSLLTVDTDFVSPAKYRELRSISCNLIEDIFLLAQPPLNNKEQNRNSLWIQFWPVDWTGSNESKAMRFGETPYMCHFYSLWHVAQPGLFTWVRRGPKRLIILTGNEWTIIAFLLWQDLNQNGPTAIWLFTWIWSGISVRLQQPNLSKQPIVSRD